MMVEIACSLRDRVKGLLLKESFEGALMLVPCRDIHTFGMRYPIDVAFLDKSGVVVHSCRIEPNRRLRCRNAVCVIERVAVDRPWFSIGDKVGLSFEHHP